MTHIPDSALEKVPQWGYWSKAREFPFRIDPESGVVQSVNESVDEDSQKFGCYVGWTLVRIDTLRYTREIFESKNTGPVWFYCIFVGTIANIKFAVGMNGKQSHMVVTDGSVMENVFGVTLDGRGAVTHVHKDSQARRKGVKQGWFFLTINGTPFESWNQDRMEESEQEWDVIAWATMPLRVMVQGCTDLGYSINNLPDPVCVCRVAPHSRQLSLFNQRSIITTGIAPKTNRPQWNFEGELWGYNTGCGLEFYVKDNSSRGLFREDICQFQRLGPDMTDFIGSGRVQLQTTAGVQVFLSVQVDQLFPDQDLPNLTAKHLELAVRPMKNIILGLASIEFGGVPLFLWLGLCQRVILGYILVLATCMCVFKAKLWAIKRSSKSLDAFKKHWGELKESTFKLPFTDTDTGMPSFRATFLYSIPQYTDNFTLCLAIGDVQAEWDSLLNGLWVKTWRRIFLMSTIAAHVSLPWFLSILMTVGLVVHACLFCVHWARSEMGGAARVANLNLIADVVELAEGDLNAPAPRQATVPATPEGRDVPAPRQATVPATPEGRDVQMDNPHQDFQEGREDDLPPGEHPAPSPRRAGLAQPLLEDTDNIGPGPLGPIPSAGSEPEQVAHEVEPPQDVLRTVGMGLDEETSEARQLAALRSRLVAKVVFGCNLRFWFKVSLQVLLWVAGRRVTMTMWISILTGVLHVALGTYPFLAKLLWAKSISWKRKLLELFFILMLLAPFWGSLVRLSGIFLCRSHVFSFSAHGCEGENTFGAPILLV